MRWYDNDCTRRDLTLDMSGLDYVFIGRLDRSLREKFSISGMISRLYIFNPDKNFIYDMNLDSREVSRRHVLLRYISDRLVIVDHGVNGLGSSYGTFIDGVKIRRGSSVVVHEPRLRLRLANVDIEIEILRDRLHRGGSDGEGIMLNTPLNITRELLKVVDKVRTILRCEPSILKIEPYVTAIEDLVKCLKNVLSRDGIYDLASELIDRIMENLEILRRCTLEMRELSDDNVILRTFENSLIELRGHLEALRIVLKSHTMLSET